jgi:acetyltransferase-like isoleucine patch superfamily enzyme
MGQGTRVTGRLRIRGHGSVVIGDDCHIEKALVVATGGSVRVGHGTFLNGPEITASRHHVSIGDGCDIADCLIMDTDFHSTQRSPRGEVRTGPIVIGDDVWLCARTAVLRGTTIGPRAVIGVGVVVRNDVPADARVRQSDPFVS